jgi:AraC-like DNA-binding protein
MLPERARLGGYREWAPPDDLRGVVAAVWSYWRPCDATPIAGRGHRLPPDGEVSLAFISQRDASGALTAAQVVLIGPIESPRFFSPARDLRIDAVRIPPEWCHDVLRADPREHVNAVDAFAESLLGDLVAAERPIAVLLDAVRKRSNAFSRDACIANDALRQLRRKPALRLESVARSLSISDRHLRRVVRGTTGFSPKQLQRFARLDGAIVAADRDAHPNWADIAAAHGYYDQPHMIEEFQSLVGCTPAQLFAERMSENSNPSPGAP